MSDKAKIIVGLVVFLVLAAFPIWYAFASGGSKEFIEPEKPANAKACIEKDMAAMHMDVLDKWRDAVVRGEYSDPQIVKNKDGKLVWNSNAGKGPEVEMSLTRTCMECHMRRETFCIRCHDYADVHPYCWECHTDQLGK
jgi:hypothetical protein